MVPTTRRVWPRRIRRAVQALAFGLFLLFIIRMPALAGTRARGDWLMRLSPFSGLGASVSSWQLITWFWPGAALLVAALFLGRFFCGWLCPLGATLDIGDRAVAFLRRRPARPHRAASGGEAGLPDFEHVPARRLKHYLLAACLVGAFLGVSFFGLFDPLSIAARSFVLAVHSLVFQALAAVFEAFPRAVGGQGTANLRGAFGARSDPVFQLQGLTLLALLGLLALGLIRRRFWCRYACPLGAMYALASKPALTKRSVSDACTSCGVCSQACPMGCISPDGRRTLNDECILCLQCQPACARAAVRFLGAAPAEQKAEVGLTRRGALTAAAAGLASYPLLRTKWAWRHAKADPLIRPPLAGRDVEAFLSKCVRCGQCMRVCPNQVIQPTGLEAGVESLWTPKVAPRPGYCEYNCALCGRACPSGAIPRFSLEEKHATALGLAYVDTSQCIPWRGSQRRSEAGFVADKWNCGVCEEVCPAPGKAIHFQRLHLGPGGEEATPEAGQELRLPYVQPDSCVGCGYCEAVCPVIGQAAIRVTGGFRQLPPQAEVPAEAPLTESALPVTSGDLRLARPKATYEGRQRLFEYIDGGAEPYLTFGFVRVTAAEYTDGKGKLNVDLWEFGASDGAFGAFAKDRRGEPADVGDAGAVLGGSLWAWRGRFMIAVTNAGPIPLEQARLLAVTALEALNEPPAQMPEVCRRLPGDGLDPMSVVYMRDARPLFPLRLADKFIADETWGFGAGAASAAGTAGAAGTVGAYGAYPSLSRDDRPAGLLLIEYGAAQAASATASGLATLRASWGEEQTAGAPYAVLRAGEGNYSVIGSRDRTFAAAFFMPSPEAGAELLRLALSASPASRP